MKEILIPTIIVAGFGLLLGLILAVASKLMAVKKDETVEKLESVLPGANCGACGFSGCSGYAQNLASGSCDTNLCQPGGNDVAIQISQILGTEAQEVVPMVATVLCKGSCENVDDKMKYDGIPSCAAANQMFSGKSACRFGCIGLGDCVKACEKNAITICNGVAVINRDLCEGCRACTVACPKGIISMLPKEKKKASVFCKNTDKGAVTKKTCKVGCIGCKICEKKCPEGAIKVENFVAIIDYEKCTACGACTEACPQKVISVI